jgi:hypothetical protein
MKSFQTGLVKAHHCKAGCVSLRPTDMGIASFENNPNPLS